MKEEDAQRMGKTVDRVGKRTILRQCVEQETNRIINKIKIFSPALSRQTRNHLPFLSV
jgi:hypothetical protein